MTDYTKVPIEKFAVLVDNETPNNSCVVFGIGDYWFINTRSILGYALHRITDPDILSVLVYEQDKPTEKGNT
jgi:hypothetical protein